MVITKTYEEFISIVEAKNTQIVFFLDETHYRLVTKDGIIFYETFVMRNGGQQQLHYEANYLADSLSSFLDVSIPTVNNVGLFTKPYTNILVLAKNDLGDPISVKSVNRGVDVQLITIVYDEDGDLLSANVSDIT